MGLGAALTIAMYDYLGYYQICYLGDEVSNPSRTIPRSILISVAAVAVVYLVMNIGILGVLPWREVIASKHIASDLILRIQGPSRGGPGDGDDHLDGTGVDLCCAFGIQPNSVRVSAIRSFFPGVCPNSSDRQFPPSLTSS